MSDVRLVEMSHVQLVTAVRGQLRAQADATVVAGCVSHTFPILALTPGLYLTL